MTKEILYEQYLNAPIFAFDIETDTTHYHWKNSLKRGLSYVADITHISFYAPGLEPLVFSASPTAVQYVYQEFNRDTLVFEEFDGEQLFWHFTPQEDDFIRAMFTRENYTAIAHNLVFDARQIFGKYHLTAPDSATFWDTLAIHVFGAWSDNVDSDDEEDTEDTEKVRQSFTLYNLTHQWLSAEDQEWWKGFKGERGNLTKLITDSAKREKLGITSEDISRYVAIDSIMAYKLYEWQKKEIEEHGFDATFDEERKSQTDSMDTLLQVELDYTRLCIAMASRGVRANIRYLHDEMAKYTALWKENLERLGLTTETEHLSRSPAWRQSYIFQFVAPPDNPRDILLHRLRTKTGAWSFNKDALKYYMESYPELIYFRYHMDLETKIEQIQNFLRHAEHDGRIHFILSRLTVTGRNAGSSPNTQNLMMKQKNRYPKGSPVEPPGTDVGYLIADEGKQLISLDCSNAENWIGAMYGMDNAMALACAAEDLHEAMASTAYFTEQWKEADEEERKRLRSIGKTITFGTSYGMGQEKLSRAISVTPAQAKEFLENKDRKFWRIAEAKRRSTVFAEQKGYTMLWTGRRVRIRKWQGKYKGYTGWNSQAQGGVGEIIVRGMLKIHERLKGFSSRIVTQVHDEIVLEIEPNEYQTIIIPIIRILSSTIPSIWNSRTTPECRWLFTLDNLENSHKWGYNPYAEYMWPVNHYVNAWGFHEYPQGETEAPTWINQWGWGELALQKELGHIEEVPEIVTEKPFDWMHFRDVLRDSYGILTNPIELSNGRYFAFPESIKVMREMHHKKGESSYPELLATLDNLCALLDEYKEWRNP